MRAPAGYYRQLLKDTYPMIRIALTHTPMYNVTKVDSENVINVFRASEDQYAEYYINGLLNGDMATIVENYDVDTYYSVGELYFKS
jgi:hypothetical protein